MNTAKSALRLKHERDAFQLKFFLCMILGLLQVIASLIAKNPVLMMSGLGTILIGADIIRITFNKTGAEGISTRIVVE